MNIVSIPDGPWDAHLDDIEQCSYEDLEGTDMFEESRTENIEHPSEYGDHHTVWFRHVDDHGFGVLWEPSNRPGTLRFASLFVRKHMRNEGIGRALVVKRFRYGLDRPDIEQLDTYAYNPRFFLKLDFEMKQSYDDVGSTYMVYSKR